MLRYAPLKIVALCMALSACVTINVYFPAAAAEKAADRVIDDIFGPDASPRDTRSRVEEPSARSEPERSAAAVFAEPATRVLLAAASGVLDLLVPPAQAQADLRISTPAVTQLRQSLRARHQQLKPYYESGAVGFARDGSIQVRDQNLIPLAERNAVRKLVADDNADRAALYREIANANGRPDWEADIRATFAQRWIQRVAAAGWYYQDADGTWTRQ
ncbi:MAG: DUF1318 domain-containing protein [Proteobacteria bacterium]|nr:MAG: DUF1318 domain-containing protein [Pseudomonadota bacterium]